MSFGVSWDKEAIRNLNKFDVFVRKRIVNRIELFAENGSFHEAKKIQGYDRVYRLRVGDYRVVFRVDGNFIVILNIGHRKNIY